MIRKVLVLNHSQILSFAQAKFEVLGCAQSSDIEFAELREEILSFFLIFCYRLHAIIEAKNEQVRELETLVYLMKGEKIDSVIKKKYDIIPLK